MSISIYVYGSHFGISLWVWSHWCFIQVWPLSWKVCARYHSDPINHVMSLGPLRLTFGQT